MPTDRMRRNVQVAAPRELSKNAMVLLPVLVTIVLNLPCLGLGYFWDDFQFLSPKRGFGGVLLPDPQATFYRPIPLGLYFHALRILDPRNGVLGHLLNLAVLLGVVVLLVRLVSRLAGRRAGLYSGLLFASYGAVPGLVAWISGSQDLFAILFVVAALYLRNRGKGLAAWACAAAGLFCKETAIVALPVLALWDWLVGRPAKRLGFQLAGYAMAALLWATLHPGIHLLAKRGFQSGSTMYVGLEHGERWIPYLVRYLMTLLNLPPLGLVASWWEDRALYGFAALAILGLGLVLVDRSRRTGESAETVPLPRIAAIAGLVALPGILMPTLLVRHWAPYFACIGGLGVAMLLGPVLARQSKPVAIAALAIFLLLGVWYRGIRAEGEWVLSETAMVEASQAVAQVRANLRKLFPSFPKETQVVASFGTSGIRGIQSALIDGQALRLWYRDPSLSATRTSDRRHGASTEIFVRITDDLDVLTVDPVAGRLRSAMLGSPSPSEIHRPLTNYARALAAEGETERAIHVLEDLNRIEPPELGNVNNRMIASFLMAAGRKGEADSILVKTPAIPREVGLALVWGFMAEPSPSEALDAAAFPAFGLSSTDPQAIRAVMGRLEQGGALEQAAWFAQKLLQLVPNDPEASGVLKRAAESGMRPRREPSLRLAAPERS